MGGGYYLNLDNVGKVAMTGHPDIARDDNVA